MEATKKHIIQDRSSIFYHQPSSLQQMNLSVQTFDCYCTLESSPGTKSHACLNNNTSSTTSFSSNGNSSELNHSPEDNSNSPLSGSSATNNNEAELSLMLKELETAMMEPELDNNDKRLYVICFCSAQPPSLVFYTLEVQAKYRDLLKTSHTSRAWDQDPSL